MAGGIWLELGASMVIHFLPVPTQPKPFVNWRNLMICFRDMTFCPFNADCKNAAKCPRALTPAIHDAAAKWWGKPGAPIAMFTQQPECHEPKRKSKR